MEINQEKSNLVEVLPAKKTYTLGGRLGYAQKTDNNILPIINLTKCGRKNSDASKTMYNSSSEESSSYAKVFPETSKTVPRASSYSSATLSYSNKSRVRSSITKLPSLSKTNSKVEGPLKNNVGTNSTPRNLQKSVLPLISVEDHSLGMDLRNEIKMLPVIFREFSLAGMGFKTNTTDALTDSIPSKSTKLNLSARGNLQPNSDGKKDGSMTRRNTVSFPSKPTTSHSTKSSLSTSSSNEYSPRSSLKVSSSKNPVRLDTSRSDNGITLTSLNSKNTGPWSAAYIMKTHKDKLSPYENKEISNFTEIYYYGAKATNKIKANSSSNNGYDDDQGDYKIINGDHICYRYEIQGILGKGTFGQVAKVWDHKMNKSFALKIIRNRSRYHTQATVEVKILDYMKMKDPLGQSNIVQTISSFYFRNHYCILFDLLSVNLYDFIKANHFKGFSLNLIRKFAVQMLNALRFLAKHHIIHCDLKPENVLLNVPTKSAITVIDFGSSCFEHEKAYTYIQSRFYRAPEVILGINYTPAIDMWSLACILAELYTGIPLFPGESELDQLGCIMETLGLPNQSILDQSTRKKYFFTNGRPRVMENSQGIRRSPGTKTLRSLLYNPEGRPADLLFVSFISDCLKYNTKERITPSAGLQHPWITQEQDIKTLLYSSSNDSDEEILHSSIESLSSDDIGDQLLSSTSVDDPKNKEEEFVLPGVLPSGLPVVPIIGTFRSSLESIPKLSKSDSEELTYRDEESDYDNYVYEEVERMNSVAKKSDDLDLGPELFP